MIKMYGNDRLMVLFLFLFPSDVPPDVVTVTITVLSKGKRGKDSEVAELTVDLCGLKNGQETEEWYPLVGMTPMGEWGSIRLRIRYLDDLVMPCDEYSPLQQLLVEPELNAVRALAEICHNDRIPLATSLLKVFRHEKRETELLRILCQAEVARENETTTLFRGASLATTLMDLYMRAECTVFLQSAVSDTIQRILDSKQSGELNPTKMDVNDDACSNAEFLLMILDQVTQSIFTSPDACPRTVRYICNCLQKAVVAKWPSPNERLVRTRVVSGFIFLRLLCPALLNPRQFGLVSETPHQMATRTLIMVAKCLQNLANLVEFGGKVRLLFQCQEHICNQFYHFAPTGTVHGGSQSIYTEKQGEDDSLSGSAIFCYRSKSPSRMHDRAEQFLYAL